MKHNYFDVHSLNATIRKTEIKHLNIIEDRHNRTIDSNSYSYSLVSFNQEKSQKYFVIHWKWLHSFAYILIYMSYRKLVVVRSRASLSDNCRIFQFIHLAKRGVVWVEYTWEYISWQTLESSQIGIETDLDEFETITIISNLRSICSALKAHLPDLEGDEHRAQWHKFETITIVGSHVL